jgi:hypothetical protein
MQSVLITTNIVISNPAQTRCTPFDLVCFGVLCHLYIMADPFDLVCFGVLCHLYIVAVSFIGRENRNTRKKIRRSKNRQLRTTRKNCFRYLKLSSPLNVAICTTTYLERHKCYGPGKKILFKKQLFDLHDHKAVCHIP